jgi:AraC family transcriptional regulator of adaptative response / DNA-3-methyladenine glycosylase II
MSRMMLSHDEMMARFYGRDRTANGTFLTGVLTTGIYCLPSCTARKPRPENVRFFGTEDEARTAGLRPCRRCRPDHFYQEYDPDLHLMATLVVDVRRRPAGFADASALAAASGIGATKLNALFRRHHHTTPAAFLARERIRAACRALAQGDAGVTEASFAAGFESLSAFHENFRRHVALTPGEYRRLGTSSEFTLALPDDFRPEYALRVIGRDAESVVERVEGSTAHKAVRLAGRPAVLAMEIADGRARCRVEALEAIPSAMYQAHEIALRLLGLTLDPAPFERRLAERPGLLPLIEGRRGLRIPQTADAFEGIAWAIVGQQVNLPFAYALRRDLVRLCGEEAGRGLRAHPAPEDVAALDYADLTALRYSRRKAEYLIDTARLAASGELPLDAFADAPATEVERRLGAVRGFGPWSVHYFMMRACGFADCVPVGDTGLPTALMNFFALDHRPGPDEVRARMEPFAPFRSLATFHLWMSLGDPA